ncbi:adenylate/guanylate cyclase domain-containing protein [Noviherbaspirillum sp. CPCC 100848]|uniref:Adenylate/guanylate cyclase domain-containing protein n=1 Tax=Noviherbaspirillum album TaxID=3080276 RepID=A0ABU6JJC5_9BURK|nr:adenylate/guanylate cyclase domain-containing protein [Noviherbaspirillum sp. CPCC 100848]MEC4723513.1 adenylate/guanylate cyclase domain-containing protein [Noviherbaspirillum sp. CPCC 100848]
MTLPASLRKYLPSVVWIRFGIAAAAVLLTAWAQWLPPVSGSYLANEWLRDHFIRVRASTVPEQRIVMIDIDEASLSKVGPWPWPRERLASLVENLVGHYKVSGVALDLVMPEPADAQGDARLAMLAQHGPVVLAQVLDYIDRDEPLRVGRITGGTPAESAPSGLPTAKATGYIANHAGLQGARHLGNIGFVPDPDGTIRYLPMVTSFNGREYLTLSAMLFQCCGNGQAAQPDEEGFWRIPYSRDWSAYTLLSASQVLALKAPAELLENRLVIIGSSSLGLTDRVATPLAPSTSGMLVHAAALTSMLDEQEGKAPARWPGRWIAVLFAVLVAGIAAYSFPRYSALSNVALLGIASALWLLLAYLIAPHDPSFSTTGPLASHLLLLAVGVPFDWQLAQRKSHSLLGTLRQYVATAVVDELLQSDLKDPLTPRELTVTTLIADMESYTTYVESLSIEEAAQLTRDFLACLTRPVLSKRGTIDKYTGDGMVAFWGAPLPVADHADLALEAARAIVEEVRRFSEVRMKAGMPALRVRIGIESGIAMAGDFGSSSRSIYTAVGDSVNVAARLEQVARNQPYDIIIGQGAVSRATRHSFKLLGDFSLRGKERTHTLYTLEGHVSSKAEAQ